MRSATKNSSYAAIAADESLIQLRSLKSKKTLLPNQIQELLQETHEGNPVL